MLLYLYFSCDTLDCGEAHLALLTLSLDLALTLATSTAVFRQSLYSLSSTSLSEDTAHNLCSLDRDDLLNLMELCATASLMSKDSRFSSMPEFSSMPSSRPLLLALSLRVSGA